MKLYFCMVKYTHICIIIVVVIIRPHRNTTYVDAAYSYRPRSVVCRSVCLSVGLSVWHTSQPCKNRYTDRAAVWIEDLGGPGNHVLDGGPDSPMGRGKVLGGELVSHCKVQGHSTVVCAKTAEPIGMPFGLWARMGRRNHWIGVHRCWGTLPWQPILGLKLLLTGFVWTIGTRQLVMKGVWVVVDRMQILTIPCS